MSPVTYETTPHGNRTLPQALDDLATSIPDRLYASVPRDRDLSNGFADVSCGDMARCVNFTAHWISTTLGRSESFETLAYIGIPDLRSAAVFLGAVKCGYRVSHLQAWSTSMMANALGSAPLAAQSTSHQYVSDGADKLHQGIARCRSCTSHQTLGRTPQGFSLLGDPLLSGHAR